MTNDLINKNDTYKALLQLATKMMQSDQEEAKRWLNTKLDVFDGKTPTEHANTQSGYKDVKDLIGRIRNGVFN